MGREYIVAVAKRRNSHDIRKMKFTTIRNGINYWVADPFPIEINGELYIFGEVFEYSRLKGAIGYTKFENGKFTAWKIVIDEKFHLSFPYLFFHEGILYMCPEACASKQLYLYKCIEFPEKWEKWDVLADNVNYSDTIYWKDGKEIYGFSCIWKDIDHHKLKMFKMVNGKAIESKGKLATLDFFLTRPAGKIFFEEDIGENIMVSQICKPLYGSGLIFKKFNLSWPNYEEQELYRIYPNRIKCSLKQDYVGMHTLNFTENYAVIDLIWDRFSIIEKFFRGIHKIKRMAIRGYVI